MKDIQDVWIFSHFIENNIDNGGNLRFMVETTGKISSVHNYRDFLNSMGINQENLILFEGINSHSFKTALGNCRYFITKDFLPFQNMTDFIDKMVIVSWVGESANRKIHKFNKKAVIPGYKKLYCEKGLVPVYEYMGHPADSRISKYYFLNGLSRKDVCKIYNLDPDQKYVTVFNNMWFNGDPTTGLSPKSELPSSTKEIYDSIIDKSKKMGYKIIVKNKMKYDAANYQIIPNTHFDLYMPGNPSLYHPGLILMALSEFSVGLATAAAVESEHLGSRFISFWKHDPISLGDELYEGIASGQGQNYRLAQGKNTFIVNKNDMLADIIDSMDVFIDNSKSDNLNKFPVDKFLEDNSFDG